MHSRGHVHGLFERSFGSIQRRLSTLDSRGYKAAPRAAARHEVQPTGLARTVVQGVTKNVATQNCASLYFEFKFSYQRFFHVVRCL